MESLNSAGQQPQPAQTAEPTNIAGTASSNGVLAPIREESTR
jgi:hypothetical protein